MPTEAEMRAHNSEYEGSVHTIPRSVHPNPSAFTDTVSTSYRPMLNIYANRLGDVAYEPDENWSREFGKKGYKINILEVGEDLRSIDHEPMRLHGQYAMKKDGQLRVNGHKLPMLAAGGRARYKLDGFEHGRVFAPNSPYVQPRGLVRDKMGKNWFGKEMPEKDIKCTRPKVFCALGSIVALVVGCILIHGCH